MKKMILKKNLIAAIAAVAMIGMTVTVASARNHRADSEDAYVNGGTYIDQAQGIDSNRNSGAWLEITPVSISVGVFENAEQGTFGGQEMGAWGEARNADFAAHVVNVEEIETTLPTENGTITNLSLAQQVGDLTIEHCRTADLGGSNEFGQVTGVDSSRGITLSPAGIGTFTEMSSGSGQGLSMEGFVGTTGRNADAAYRSIVSLQTGAEQAIPVIGGEMSSYSVSQMTGAIDISAGK